MDGTIDRPQQLPKRRRGPVAEHCGLSIRKYGCHPAAVQVTDRVPYGIDTSMHPMQTTTLRALRHSSAAKPRLFKLPKRDHPMLPTSNRSDQGIRGGGFVSHELTKPPSAFFSPPL